MTKAIASMAIAMATETGQVDLIARLSQESIVRRAINFGQWQMCSQDCSEVVHPVRIQTSRPKTMNIKKTAPGGMRRRYVSCWWPFVGSRE